MGNRAIREEGRSYGAPTGVQAPIDTGRPSVGPADPATRAAKLKEALGAKEPAAPAPPPPVQENPTRDLSAEGAARKLRNRGRQIDQAVDDNS